MTMHYFKTYLLLILIISPCFGNAQNSIKNIPPQFNLFELNPDSTLKAIYQTKNDVLKGWAIEFDENGSPNGIGKYKNNVKHGIWRYSDGLIIDFDKTKHTTYEPPYCGTANFPRLKKFYKLVDKKLNVIE